jgi:hypothetical protein
MVCPPATSEAEARWPRFGLVVVATTSRRDNKDQMIRPYIPKLWRTQSLNWMRNNKKIVIFFAWGCCENLQSRSSSVPNSTLLFKKNTTKIVAQ